MARLGCRAAKEDYGFIMRKERSEKERSLSENESHN